MKRNKVFKCLITSFFGYALQVNAGWESPGLIKEVYFESEGAIQRMTLVMENQFHQCGWAEAAEFRTDYLDQNFYQTLVSAALSAKIAKVPATIYFNGCQTNRARSYAIKLDQ